MSVADELIRNNRRYADSFGSGDLPASPARRLAVVACMDARLDVYGLLGLEVGEAHVIRNAGGVVTDDVVRSLLISQRLLGTREIVLIHHTDCGMLTFRDDDVKRQVYDEVGLRPPFALEAFDDAFLDVHQSIARIEASPFVASDGGVRGLVFDVKTGQLLEVESEGRATAL
jgi:carbonic anhydrase